MAMSRVDAVRLVLAMAMEYADTTVSSEALKKAKEEAPHADNPVGRAQLIQAEAVKIVFQTLADVAGMMDNPKVVHDLASKVKTEHPFSKATEAA